MIDGYRDFEPIGSGGFSWVYRAYQIAYDRTVAVKVLTADVDDDTQRRFQRECALTGRLTGHPYIVTVLDSGLTADGQPFLTTEYYARGSLSQVLTREGRLPVRDALALGVKVAGALETAHRAGVLHRDVKPQNILVSAFGEPALGDFGISTAALNKSQSMSNEALTLLHAPPEVLEGDTNYPTSDVYSLASTVYCALAGHAPFATVDPDSKREGLYVVLQRILNEPLPTLDRDDVPSQLVDVLRKAMSKHAEERYSAPVEFGEALQQVEQEHFGHSTPLVCPPPDEPWEPPSAAQPFTDDQPMAPPAGLVTIRWADLEAGVQRLVVSFDDEPKRPDRQDAPSGDRLVVDLDDEVWTDTTVVRPRRARS